MSADWIMTSRGRMFYPLAPSAEDVDIRDIAHALGAVNRFNGHTREPYSVAQHSILLSLQFEADGPEMALFALLHDASEAYLGDVPRPLKQTPAFAPYREAEARLEAVIFGVFGLAALAQSTAAVARLKAADRRMLRTEQAQLMPPPAAGEVRDDVEPFKVVIDPWDARTSTLSFLLRFHTLGMARGTHRSTNDALIALEGWTA